MLREDNADLRLTEHGRRLGIVDDERWGAFCRKRDAIGAEQERLNSVWVGPRNTTREIAERVLGQGLEREYTLASLLRRPNVSYRSLSEFPNSGALVQDEAVIEQIEIQAKYYGYVERQRAEVERRSVEEGQPLPSDLDYASVRGLSKEVQQKLASHRPETIGQAARLSGVTPAAISLLLVHLKRGTAPQKKRA